MRIAHRGFTLVELLASITVIALSMTICLPAPQHAIGEGEIEDEGPVTVRVFVCDAAERDLAQAELEIREALVSTHLEFCSVEFGAESEVRVAVWARATESPDSDLQKLRKVLGRKWNVRHSQAPAEELVASL